MRNHTRSEEISRRDFVGGVSALGAVWLLAASCTQQDAAPKSDTGHIATESPAPPQELTHFSATQAADIDAIASRIIPTDDSPGAHEAGVVFFIDRAMTGFAKDQAPLFDTGLVELNKTVKKTNGADATFAKLTPEQQDTLLKSMEKSDFFGAMRFATIAGFLALPKYGGNKDYIGWKFIGQDQVFENKPPFGWYDRPENQQALLGKVL